MMRADQIREHEDFNQTKNEYSVELAPIVKGIRDLIKARDDAETEFNEKLSFCQAHELSVKNAELQIEELEKKLSDDEDVYNSFDSIELLESKIKKYKKFIQVLQDDGIPKAQAKLAAAEDILFQDLRVRLIAHRGKISGYLDEIITNKIEFDLLAWDAALLALCQKFKISGRPRVELQLNYHPVLQRYMKSSGHR